MRWKALAVLIPVGLLSVQTAATADLAEIRSMIDQGRAAEAMGSLEAHLGESPADAEALFLRGLLLAESQREGQALEVFEEVAGLRPDRPEPLNNLAVIQAANGDYESAVETLKVALRTHPAYRTAYENLTKIYGQLASEAYSRALSVEQGPTRAAVELVLLSDMVLPQPEDVRMAAAESLGMPAEPLPVTLGPDASEEPVAAMEPVADPGSTEPESEMAPTTQIASTSVAEVDPEASIEALPAEAATPDEAIAAVLAEEEPSDSGAEVFQPEQEEAARPGDLANLVEAWALAWSEQRVEDYLYFYSRDFVPPGELRREDWEDQRRARLLSPEFVRVSVAFLDFEGSGPNRALVRFNQSYESNTFSDVVTKTLELVREDSEWKILKETVDS